MSEKLRILRDNYEESLKNLIDEWTKHNSLIDIQNELDSSVFEAVQKKIIEFNMGPIHKKDQELKEMLEN